MNPCSPGSSADNPSSELGGHATWLRRRAYDLARNEELARDLVQDTFLAYLKRPPSIDRSLRAWLEAVMRNHFRMWCRSSDRRSRRELATLRDDFDPGPEPHLDRQRTAAVLAEALAGIQEPYRSTLHLRYYEGLQPAQIARRLGVPQSTVRRRSMVGLKLVRTRLLSHFGNSEERLDQALVRALIPTVAWHKATGLPERTLSRWIPSLGVAAVVAVGWLVVSDGSDTAATTTARHSQQFGTERDARHSNGANYVSPARLMLSQLPSFPPAWQFDSGGDSGEVETGVTKSGNRRTPPALLSCGKLQDRINAAAAGNTIDVPPCIFRESIVIDKPLFLRGQPGTEVRGSDVFSEWTRVGETWRSAKTIPDFPEQNCTPTPTGENSNEAICWTFEQVFVDGTRLAPVATTTNLLPGRFAIDAQRHVILAEDPATREVEVAVRPHWGRVRANDVTISGFTFTHALGGTEMAALTFDRTATRARLHRSHLSHSGGIGLRIAGNDTTVSQNLIQYSGGMALSVVAADRITISGNELTRNGLAHRLDNGWVTGGIGMIAARVEVQNNRIIDNRGIGISCVGCSDSLVRANRIGDNAAAAVINFGARNVTITQNIFWHNGQTFKHPAMFITQSNALVVSKNTFAFHDRGVVVNVQDFAELPSGFQTCTASRNNNIEENTFLDVGESAVMMTGDPRPLAMVKPCPSNRSISNRVWDTREAQDNVGGDLLALSPVEREDALHALLGDHSDERLSGPE
ncbi:MAG: sigma-70 family RNA polymerase sigma factor [Deltaproteobacteria bacterium]|nr:sigma-70 family RNA polymerase sigma factor [Deltaproteobacteria bacterium]